MCVSKLCHKLLSNTSIHKKRVQVIGEVLKTILSSKRLGVTQVGRKMQNDCQTRSNIKKVDRLYSNAHLLNEQHEISRSIARYLLKTKQPLITVDGSKLPNSPWYILRASFVYNGRGITLYETIYDRCEEGSPSLYKQFLRGLESILPKDVSPILITDAQFQRPWFELVENLGWDFIGRVRGNKNCAIGDEDFQPIQEVFEQATYKPRSLGLGLLNVQEDYLGYYYLYRNKNKGRHAHTRSGCHSETEKSKKHAKSSKEPWLIFSSLDYPAKQIIKAYAYRMTIEENFRDMKSGRYGLGLRMTHSKKKHRYQVMLILAMLAAVIAYLIGYIAESKEIHYQFQPCSRKKKRILSRFFLGCELVYKNWKFSISDLEQAVDDLQEELYDSFKI